VTRRDLRTLCPQVFLLMAAPSPFMTRALELARTAKGRTSPNPPVGAVVVRDGEIVGEGFTQPPGSWHAEVLALRQAGDLARGAKLYVTLEPCCHYGRTPPCTRSIIEAGVAEVHMAMLDPNPIVCGQGRAELEAAGIRTSVGDGEEIAAGIVEAFTKFITTGLPFVTAKFAMSLDGKIATRTGQSRWITGEGARLLVHRLRDAADAVMVGVGTVLADDPLLTVRLPLRERRDGRQPWRVVVDSRGRTPLTARVLGADAPTIVATTEASPPEWRRQLAHLGAIVLELPAKEGHVDLKQLLVALGKRGLIDILVEGGSGLLGSLFAQRLVDKVLAFVAPLVIGGTSTPGPIGGDGVQTLDEAPRLRTEQVERVGDDILIVARCLPE